MDEPIQLDIKVEDEQNLCHYYQPNVINSSSIQLEKTFEINEQATKDGEKDFESVSALSTNDCGMDNDDFDDEEHECTLCARLFQSEKQFKAHMKEHAKLDGLLSDNGGEKEFQTINDAEAKDADNQSIHSEKSVQVQTNTKESPFKCSHCPKKYATKLKLQKHLNWHKKGRRYKCEICSKSFPYPSHLEIHLRSHTDERRYKCDLCSKTFKTPGDLKGHKQAHTGERPFTCEICSKSFYTPSALKLPCKLWDVTRLIRKTFMCQAKISCVIAEGNKRGIQGSKILLETDGSEVEDDATLQHFMKNNSTLMLVTSSLQWSNNVGGRITPDLQREIWITPDLQREISITPDLQREILKSPNTFADDLNCSVADGCVRFSDNLSQSTEDCFEQPELAEHTVIQAQHDVSSDSKQIELEKLKKFRIPWGKIPSSIMEKLRKKHPLTKEVNSVANIIVDELRCISTHIPLTIFRMIVEEACLKYPDSFKERNIDGEVISSSIVPLLTIMRNRNNFLNRRPNTEHPILLSDCPVKKRRTCSTLKATCSNWQPIAGDVSHLTDKKKYLCSLYGREHIGAENKNICIYMKECFPLQRNFFNNLQTLPTVSDTKREWPFIFIKTFLDNHFEQLMHIKPEIFSKQFEMMKGKMHQIFKVTETATNAEEKLVAAIVKYFKENVDILFRRFEFGKSSEEIQSEIDVNTPCIAITGRCDGNDHIYIFFERQIVMSLDYCLPEAISIVIKMYFIFNVMYPEKLSQTLEFFVRGFFKHYAPALRGTKKHINSLAKVHSLIKKFAF